MTASKQEFDSAAMLLKEVWYAKDHLDATERTIDWQGIQLSAAQISPSDSEELLVAMAQGLWSSVPRRGGNQIVEAIHFFDNRMYGVFLEALRIRRWPGEEAAHERDVQDNIGRAEEAASGGAS